MEKTTNKAKLIRQLVGIVVSFVWQIYRKDISQSSDGLCCFDFIMGEPEKPSCSWYRDFWMCPWLSKPNFLSLETPENQDKSRELLNRFQDYYFGTSKMLESILWGDNLKQEHTKINGHEKHGHREIMKSRLQVVWNSWIWDQYLPENMQWKCGNMGLICSNKTWKDCLNLWSFETLKIWNSETKKQRNQGTKKPRNPETKKLRD